MKPGRPSGSVHCGTCPTAALIASGKYRKTPYRMTPCAACGLAREQRMIHREGVSEYDQALSPDQQTELAARPWIEPQLVLQVMRDFVRDFMQLQPDDRELLAAAFQGEETCAAIAARMHITRQAVHKRLRRITAEWPSMREALGMRKSVDKTA